METKYDHIVNFFLNNWLFAVILIIAIIIISLPRIKDGIKTVFPFSKQKKDFIIEYADEKISFDVKMRSYDYDIVKIHATTHRLGIQTERKWLQKYYPGYSNNMQAQKTIKTKKGEIIFDILSIQKGDIKKKIYFDITDFFEGASVVVTNDINKYAMKKIYKIYDL